VDITARRYDTGTSIRLEVRAGRVARSEPLDVPAEAAASLPWIAPGFIDIQINGYGGQEFSAADLTVEKVAEIVRAVAGFGVAKLLPTATTHSPDTLAHAMRTVAAACETDPEVAGRVAGIHLEGPFISPEEGVRGAHPLEHIRPPDWDEFQRLQEAAGGRIRLLTLAPEQPEALRLIERLADHGVVVALGHTAASGEAIRAAVDAGARLSTHLGNGCHQMLPRHHNYVWEQLAEDRLWASLIGDGHHLPPAMVKTFVRAKTPERCLLVSDMSGQAGLPPGRHAGGLCDVEILPGGRLVIAGQRELLAGAAAPIGEGIANVMAMAGLSLAQAVAMASTRPAELLGLEPGGLEPGDPAELVLFDLVDETVDSDLPDVAGNVCRPRLVVRATVGGG
jgi:N-acetylglucosamine-6-phosphate deacetylase